MVPSLFHSVEIVTTWPVSKCWGNTIREGRNDRNQRVIETTRAAQEIDLWRGGQSSKNGLMKERFLQILMTPPDKNPNGGIKFSTIFWRTFFGQYLYAWSL